MSRIAGILTVGSDADLKWMVHAMLEAVRSDPSWSLHCERTDKVTLGWCGWEAPSVAAVNGVLVVMDGCIYNCADFEHAESDAALLGSLYERYGFIEAVGRLNGDFATALYDPLGATLWLARDRFGVKPLYYASGREWMAFASRPRGLLTLPGISREVNRQFAALFAVSHYRMFDNEPERSPYVDIGQLPPGHALCLRHGTLKKIRYWSLEPLPDFTESEDELAERYRELLLDAVSLRLTAARRPAFTLSGGMDSSSVLACATRVTGKKQHAFSSVYTDKTYDESADIQSMLDAAVEQWHPMHVGNPDVLSLVREMIAIHDEPVATATWLSHYLLCQAIRDSGFGSVFGGLGGDELNAGEYDYFLFFFADLRAAGGEALLERETKKWIAYHDHPVFRKTYQVMRDALSRLIDPSRPGRCLPDQERLRRYCEALNTDYFNLETFEPVMDHPFSSYLKNRAYQDIFRETIPCCLRAEDRHTTAFGLGHFDPFFDHRLVEFMFRVPGTLKIKNGVTKHLLRKAMRGMLPEETRTRVKKTGWNAPAHVWFSGKGHDLLMDIVQSRAFRERGIYNVAQVLQLIDEHDRIVSSGRIEENHMMFLWQLVNLEVWLQSN